MLHTTPLRSMRIYILYIYTYIYITRLDSPASVPIALGVSASPLGDNGPCGRRRVGLGRWRGGSGTRAAAAAHLRRETREGEEDTAGKHVGGL